MAYYTYGSFSYYRTKNVIRRAIRDYGIFSALNDGKVLISLCNQKDKRVEDVLDLANKLKLELKEQTMLVSQLNDHIKSLEHKAV